MRGVTAACRLSRGPIDLHPRAQIKIHMNHSRCWEGVSVGLHKDSRLTEAVQEDLEAAMERISVAVLNFSGNC